MTVMVSSTGRLMDAITVGTPRFRAASTREQNPQTLPGSHRKDSDVSHARRARRKGTGWPSASSIHAQIQSEEHTSELQSHLNLVCRLLLEKKKTTSSPYDQPH